MKKIALFLFLLSAFTVSMTAQNSSSNVEVGDTFIIGEVANDQYKHINFPKANIVIKKGGIVNYDLLKGKKVEVTSIKENKKGATIATVKLASGKRFFNSHRYITVDIDSAIAGKELHSK
ncbi:MAG: dihydroorotase [Flavobacteriaceae bacterium]